MGHTSAVLCRQIFGHLVDVSEEGFFLRHILSFTPCPLSGLFYTSSVWVWGNRKVWLCRVCEDWAPWTAACSLISASTFDSFCPSSRGMAVYFVVKPLAVCIIKNSLKLLTLVFLHFFIHLLHCFPPKRWKFDFDCLFFLSFLPSWTM